MRCPGSTAIRKQSGTAGISASWMCGPIRFSRDRCVSTEKGETCLGSLGMFGVQRRLEGRVAAQERRREMPVRFLAVMMAERRNSGYVCQIRTHTLHDEAEDMCNS